MSTTATPVRSQNRLAQDAAFLEKMEVNESATLELHRSNLLRLQVDELLKETTKDPPQAQAEEYISLLAAMIDKSTKAKTKTHIMPVSTLGWTKPSGNAQVLPTYEMMVRISSSSDEGEFHGKDYQSYRYHEKRNLIMAKVAKSLCKQAKKLGRITYQWPNAYSPYLRIQPALSGKQKSSKFQLYVYFGMDSIDWIPAMRLIPNRNNVKKTKAPTSPFHYQYYNHSLLHDARHLYQDEHLKTLEEEANMKSTLVMIQVWALQRGLWRNHDGWSKEHVALLLVYLSRMKKINRRMTPVQMLTVVLQTWATVDWMGDDNGKEAGRPNVRVATGQGSILPSSHKRRRQMIVLPVEEDHSEEATIRRSHIAKIYEQHTHDTPLTDDDPPTLVDLYSSLNSYALGPVFLDPTMTYNYLGYVSPNYMRLLQSHAKSCMDVKLEFSSLFLTSSRFWDAAWDMYVEIPTTSSDWEDTARKLDGLLRRALGNRIRGLRVLSTGNGHLGSDDTDQIRTSLVTKALSADDLARQSPTGSQSIVFGISVDPDTCHRIVDRGPPMDQARDVREFMELWGKEKAQLRRFNDGAIVQAVVWDASSTETEANSFQNGDRWNGGVIQRIVRLHIAGGRSARFSMPNILSIVDGTPISSAPFSDPVAAHRNLRKAFDSLSEKLRTSNDNMGLPLSIDAVEPLSPCLRYSELFPPLPHSALGGPAFAIESKVSGASLSDSISIQLRLGSSSKWPADVKAVGAAKAAMLVQLAKGLEGSKLMGSVPYVTTSYVEVGYQGYSFKIFLRPDQELRLLLNSSPVAKELIRHHMLAPLHHGIINAVHTLHPSASGVVRMAQRWVGNHMLSGHLPHEALELIVAKVYSSGNDDNVGNSYMHPPGTVATGFLRFLRLLATYDWARSPFVVNPRGHISKDDLSDIDAQFQLIRGSDGKGGPAMYFIAPYNRQDPEDGSPPSSVSVWSPSTPSPELVVLRRAMALAKQSYEHLRTCLTQLNSEKGDNWSNAFVQAPAAFQSYSILLRVDTGLIVDTESSSTCSELGVKDGVTSFSRSLKAQFAGPKALRRKAYRNLQNSSDEAILTGFTPVTSCVNELRRRFASLALIFFNERCPQVIGLVWRPGIFDPRPFSVLHSEHTMPSEGTFLVRNANDILRDMGQYFEHIVTNVKVLDERGMVGRASKRQKLEDGDNDNSSGEVDDESE